MSTEDHPCKSKMAFVKPLSGFDQMERELQTAAANMDVILHLDTVPTRQKSKIQAER